MALWLFISPRPKLVTTRGFCTPLPPRMLFAASWLILFLLLECALPRAVGVCVCASATFLNVIIQATSSPAKTQCSRKRTETCMSDAMLKRFPYFLFELLQVSLNFTQGDIWIGRYPFTIRLVKGLMMDGLCARVSHLPIGVEEVKSYSMSSRHLPAAPRSFSHSFSSSRVDVFDSSGPATVSASSRTGDFDGHRPLSRSYILSTPTTAPIQNGILLSTNLHSASCSNKPNVRLPLWVILCANTAANSLEGRLNPAGYESRSLTSSMTQKCMVPQALNVD